MSKSDKSTSTPATPTTPIPPNVTKLCHMIKREDFDGYGFNLHSEKIKPGQFIGKVDPDSPAEEAGLKEGDRIIEVNGVAIGNETHKQVVQRIKALANEVRLLLIDVDGKGDPPKTTATIISKQKCSSEVDSCKEQEEMPALPKTSPPSTPLKMNDHDSSTMEYHGTKLELPGESANISSISMVSVKRMSSTSSGSNNGSIKSNDVVDKAMPASPLSARSQDMEYNQKEKHITPISTPTPPPITTMPPQMPLPDLTNDIIEKKSSPIMITNNNNNNNIKNINNNNDFDRMMPPLAPIIEPTKVANVQPPPSSVIASNTNNTTSMNGSHMLNNNISSPSENGTSTMSSKSNFAMTSPQNHSSPSPTSTPTPAPLTNSPNSLNSPPLHNNNGTIKAGSLNLPMTAAEMRAKLLSKKKYDPKQESVDLRKKFEIIQKL